jgi:hypothetical protein
MTQSTIALMNVGAFGLKYLYRFDEKTRSLDCNKLFNRSNKNMAPDLNFPDIPCWIKITYTSESILSMTEIENPCLSLVEHAKEVYDFKSLYPVRSHYYNGLQYVKECDESEYRFELLHCEIKSDGTTILKKYDSKFRHKFNTHLALVGFIDNKYHFIPLERCAIIKNLYLVSRNSQGLSFYNHFFRDVTQLLTGKLYVF